MSIRSAATSQREPSDIRVRERLHAPTHRSRRRISALYLPEITDHCAPIPCAYQVVRQDYSELRSGRSGVATAPLTARYDSQPDCRRNPANPEASDPRLCGAHCHCARTVHNVAYRIDHSVTADRA